MVVVRGERWEGAGVEAQQHIHCCRRSCSTFWTPRLVRARCMNVIRVLASFGPEVVACVVVVAAVTVIALLFLVG